MSGISSAPLPLAGGVGGGPSSSAAPRVSPPLTPPASGRGITGVDTGLSRLATADNLNKAGRQFETAFTGMMLKAMRQAKLADPLFDSKALDTFRDMQDQTVVQAMAEHAPLGIGKAMADFLARALPPQPDVNPTGPSE